MNKSRLFVVCYYNVINIIIKYISINTNKEKEQLKYCHTKEAKLILKFAPIVFSTLNCPFSLNDFRKEFFCFSLLKSIYTQCENCKNGDRKSGENRICM